MNEKRQKILDKLNPKQKKVLKRWLKDKPLWTINHGAVRSGKSFVDHIKWLMHVSKFRDRGLSFILTGHTLPALKRNVLDDLNEMFGIDTRLDSSNTFQMFGNKMRCFGTDKCDSYKAIKGFTGYGLYANEIQLSHKTAIEEAVKRCSGEGSIIIGDCNPDNPNHWVHTDIILKDGAKFANGKVLYQANHFTIEDNAKKNGGVLTDEYIESLDKTLSGIAHDRDYKGLWVAREGIVYDCFVESQMICETPLDKSNSFAGVDWGFEHFGVIVVLCEYNEKIVIADIIKERHKTIDWWYEKKKEIEKEYKCKDFYCDTARPEYVQKFNGIESDKSVIEGIDKVYSMLYNGELLVAERCKKLFLEELYGYRWKDTAPKEQPVKENDDIMDALRYAIFTRYGKSQKPNLYRQFYGKKKNVSKNS